MSADPKARHDFGAAARQALADTQLHGNLRRAMDGLMHKRAVQFPDPDEWTRLRALGEAVRQRALSKLPDLLEQLEATCTANGITVHWAETPEQANTLFLEIIRKQGADYVVKGKSMVSEETHLNAYLEANGIAAVETDLGEYVIQLAGETPSHIIMPCIHKNKREIAHLFEDNIPGAPYTEDVEELTAMARAVLRERFATAKVGISGVNMAVAETGTLILVENEGNGRLSTTAPDVHIAISGIEKVVEKLEEAAPILSLLPRSATGQHTTTYVNMINGPRRGDDLDGPRDVHLILLDNGRSRVYRDPELRPTLHCIRCGACMNHCPVYTRVGGHAYGAVYPGPIGKILTPQLEGLGKQGDLPSASSLCNACVEVCPVRIPIARILVKLRLEASHDLPGSAVAQCGARKSAVEALTWKAWALSHRSGPFYRLLGRFLTLVGPLIPGSLPPLKNWTLHRTKPKFTGKTLHQMARDRGYDHE
ncbi:MAG: LutB/LldF family L-lactate oxidation iron-sulfur protein [Magnetospiraceae bacterium]